MPELLLLTRRFAGELAVRVGLGLLGMFSALYMLGLVLSDSVPEWIKSVDFLFAFSRALRALPPWDFALIALAIVIIVGYIQRIFQFLLRRRNTLHLKKLSLEDMNASTSAVSPGERRWKMMARGRLLARVMIFATVNRKSLGSHRRIDCVRLLSLGRNHHRFAPRHHFVYSRGCQKVARDHGKEREFPPTVSQAAIGWRRRRGRD
jgi:hypothetical protein